MLFLDIQSKLEEHCYQVIDSFKIHQTQYLFWHTKIGAAVSNTAKDVNKTTTLCYNIVNNTSNIFIVL